MANFALDLGSSDYEVISSLNYALANLGSATGLSANVLVADTTTGEITNSTSGQVLAYLYQYLCIRYADSPSGPIYSSPTNHSYFGILNNSTGTYSTNPADYIWTQVTGGFGTTKFLWYASLGGRQIQWYAGVTPPATNYTQVLDNTPINLDIITGAVSNQLINQSIYLRANTQPVTPTGGNFNFTTLTLYPPVNWYTTVPAGTDEVYLSQAIFNGNAGNVTPSTAWSYPVILASNFAGNTGPQGSRGPIPLGYVITDSDPTYWVDSQYSTAFEAPRANVVAPIGVSPYGQTYTPISGDTAQFFWPNLAYPNSQVTIVKSFSSNTSPNWQTVLANVVSGSVIYTGTITSAALNTNDVYAINITGGTGVVGDIYTHGYWLQANTGSAAFGGNLYIGDNLKAGVNAQIGANLNVGINATIGGNLTVGNNAVIGGNATVAGVITTGALNANIVTTNQLVVNSATQTINIADNTPYPLINWVNGNATINGTGYIWPNYTRGFAIGGGATLTTTTNGSVTGSKIMVNYNAYINSTSHPEYNLVELWKSGASPYYRTVFNVVRSSSLNGRDYFSIPGTSGALYSGNIGSITSYSGYTASDYYDAFYLPSSNYVYAFGQSGAYLNLLPPSTALFNGNIATAVTTNTGSYSAYPLFNIYGADQIAITSGSTYLPTVLVGASGYIAFWTGTTASGGYYHGNFAFETSGVYADLNDITSDLTTTSFAYAGIGPTVNYVTVGTAGTILYNSRTYSFATAGNIATTSGWAQAASGTINNLNSVQSNTGLTTRANTWVAVGDAGTILYSTSASGPWLPAATVPTTQNLYGVGWTNNNWVAVGDSGTIITSTDGSNWTGPISNPADGNTAGIAVRDLKGVAGGPASGKFVVAGEEIILTSNTTSPSGGWTSNAYLGGSSVNSTLTRVQYFGSWANVANVSLPPTQQQITNAQIVSGTYTDINYTSGQNITYYLVLGNMFGNVNVYTNGPNMSVTEFKR